MRDRATGPLLRAERSALCDTLERLGPDAPTLCEGWTTFDLATHLVVRERDPRAAPGILFGSGRLGRYTERLMSHQEEKGYGAVLARLREGPPRIRATAFAGTELIENWVHHEDVRRANGEEPRPPHPGVSAVMAHTVKRLGRVHTRRLRPYGVELALSDGTRLVLRRGTRRVIVHGPVEECVLYLNGRRAAARVTLEGDEEAVEAIRRARLGL